ncbi:unnamed protein product [Aphanomyces euteiches]
MQDDDDETTYSDDGQDKEVQKVLHDVLHKRKLYRAKAAQVIERELAAQAKSAALIRIEEPTVVSVQEPQEPNKRKTLRDFELPPFTSTALHLAPASRFVALVAVSTQFQHLPPLDPAFRSAATALHQVLCNVAGFHSTRSKLLINPTLVQFQEELATFEHLDESHTTFLLVLVSHGVRVVQGAHMGTFFLFPESRVTSVEELIVTSLHDQVLAAALNRIPAAHQLLAFDVCHSQNVLPVTPPTSIPTVIQGRVNQEFGRKLLDAMLQLRKEKSKSSPQGPEALPVLILEACLPRTQVAVSQPPDCAFFLRRLADAFRGGGASPRALDNFKNWTEDDFKFPYLHARDICNFVISRVQFDAYRAASRAKEAIQAKGGILSIQFEEAAAVSAIEQTPHVVTDDLPLDFLVGKVPNVPTDAPSTPHFISASMSSLQVAWKMPPAHSDTPILGYQLEICGAGRAAFEKWSMVSTKQVYTLEDVLYNNQPPPQTMVATGLASDAGYCFRVRARNAGGWGPYSSTSPVMRTSAATSSTSYLTDSKAKNTPEEVVAWMSKYEMNGHVQRLGCKALAAFALEGKTSMNNRAASHVVQAGGFKSVLSAMKGFPQDIELQVAGAHVVGLLCLLGAIDKKTAGMPQAKILLDDMLAKYDMATYPQAHSMAQWAKEMIIAPHKRKMGMNEAAMKLQGLFRQRLARRRLRAMASQLFPALVDPTTGLVYYYNTRTGASSWTPPSLFL